jgi:hypothetical protein
VLVDEQTLPVRFDRANQPDTTDSSEPKEDRSQVLFPLACALASDPQTAPVVPILTWRTLLGPFDLGLSYSTQIALRPPWSPVGLGDRIPELEQWARLVEGNHAPSVDVAANRLASAVAGRLDRSDALIDAIMLWENLVGSSNELTFRVTAAIAKMLEKDPSKRQALRKSLEQTYSVRSKVVHGAAIDGPAVDKACTAAIDVAIRILRVCYELGPEWLAMRSNERADAVLLEWP